MTRQAAITHRRMIDLLVERATEGLGESEANELERLLALFPEQNAEEFDLTAAEINLAMMCPASEPLPARLRDRLMMDAGMYFGACRQNNSCGEPVTQTGRAPLASRRAPRLGHAPWLLAAASLALAFLGLWTIFHYAGSSPSVSTQYAKFLKNRDIVRAVWVGNEEGYTTVSGEALWRDASQTGYMRFVGLEPNDPERFQYQLWIIDSHRDKYPVDGGIFDVPNTGEVIVPMNARLRVDRPRTFAVTLEKAGGVVVSEGPLLLVGNVPG